MRQVTGYADVAATRAPGRAGTETLVVEIDGTLDAVTAHDLLRLVADPPVRHVRLDLSRVTQADVDGIAGLARCSAHAVRTGLVLTWSRCSPALLLALAHHHRSVATAS